MPEFRPFTQMYDNKNDFLCPVYFKAEVLEKYFKNPKYIIFYSDYRGTISIKDEYINENSHYEYIRDFGLAYLKTDKNKRAIVTFANDMIKLPAKVQAYWFSFLIEEQKLYEPNYGFYQNLILGQWIDNISIYQALLMEIHYINKMCLAMKIKKLFKEEYIFNNDIMEQRPIHYHDILLPTRDNYYNFINTLEKLVVNNLNNKTFIEDAPLIKSIERKDEQGNPKGTLFMLKEWLIKNVKGADIEKDVTSPLKKLRKLRQMPAHELYDNVYNEKIWQDQKNLMKNIYTAVRNIRLIFANNPFCSIVEIPDYLYDGKHISIY